MSKRQSRRKTDVTEEKGPEKGSLKELLREKLQAKKLSRTSRHARDLKADALEEKLENTTDPEEKKRIINTLELIDKIEDKENSFSGEFPDYAVRADMGGQMEHSD